MRHPFDEGVWLGNVLVLADLPEEITAVVSLCPVGHEQVPDGVVHVPFRLIDEADEESNRNVVFVLRDAAERVAEPRFPTGACRMGTSVEARVPPAELASPA